MRKLAALSLASLLSMPAIAAPLSGEAGLGVLSTTGNSETRSINGKLALDYTREAWKNAFVAQAINAADSGETTGERYVLTDKLDINFYERNYVFLAGEYQKDLFGGVRERMSETVGLGRHFLVGPRSFLDVELGGGARQQQEQGTRDKDSDLIGRASALYRYKLSDTSGIQQNLKVESGNANTFYESFSELKLYLIGNLFVGLSLTVQSNSSVAPGVKKTDSITAVNLSYAFGKEKPTS